MRRYAIFFAIFALIVAGCGSDDDSSDEQDSAQTSEVTEAAGDTTPDETTPEDEGTDSDVTLTLVTNDAFSSVAYLLDPFTAETGIDINLIAGGDAGSLVNQAILTKNNPLGDVIYGFDNTFLSRVLEADITVPYESPGSAGVSAEMQLDSTYSVTAVDFGDVCINYDKVWFADNGIAIPETFDDLAKPEYDGLLTVQNPATSSPGLAFMLATISEYGEQGWLDYWAKLTENDVEVVSGWDEAYFSSFSGAGVGGPRPLVVSYASSPPAEIVFAETPIDEASTGIMESTCFRQVEYIAILQGSEFEAEAQQLIDWWLTDAMQAELPLNYFVFPVNPDTEIPQVFLDYTTVPESPHTLDPDLIAENREQWLDDWTSTVLR